MAVEKKGKIICLTGGIGCGKSRISELLKEEFGFHVLDSDLFTKKYVMKPGMEGYGKIVSYFGGGILSEDKSINRKKLAEIVFSDNEKLKKLNSFTHPATIKALKEECRRLFKEENRLVFIESAIPFAADYEKFCDELWYVYATKETRIKRLVKNRGYSRKKCLDIMKQQPTEKQYRLHASMVIDNNDGADRIKQKNKISKAVNEWFASQEKM